MSYFSESDYGYDQIAPGDSDIRDVLYNNDSNSLDNVDKVYNREQRLFKKLNDKLPRSEFKAHYKKNKQRPNLFTPLGSYIEQQRMEKRNNIEDYYYSGNDFKDRVETFKNKYIKDGILPEDMTTSNNIMIMFIFLLVYIILIQSVNMYNMRIFYENKTTVTQPL